LGIGGWLIILVRTSEGEVIRCLLPSPLNKRANKVGQASLPDPRQPRMAVLQMQGRGASLWEILPKGSCGEPPVPVLRGTRFFPIRRDARSTAPEPLLISKIKNQDQRLKIKEKRLKTANAVT